MPSGRTPAAGCSTGCRGRPPARPQNPDFFLRDCLLDFALSGDGRRGRARPMTEREIFVAAYQRPALALMDHPNIATVLDGGVTADGRPFFVMELVQGVSITRYDDEQRLTPRQRLALFG